MDLIKRVKMQSAKSWSQLGDWLLGPAAQIANGTFLGEFLGELKMAEVRRAQPATSQLPRKASIERLKTCG